MLSTMQRATPFFSRCFVRSVKSILHILLVVFQAPCIAMDLIQEIARNSRPQVIRRVRSMQRRFFCLAEDRKRKSVRCGPSHGSCAEGARETSSNSQTTPWNSSESQNMGTWFAIQGEVLFVSRKDVFCCWKELLRERSKWQEEKKQLEEALKESVLAVGEDAMMMDCNGLVRFHSLAVGPSWSVKSYSDGFDIDAGVAFTCGR